MIASRCPPAPSTTSITSWYVHGLVRSLTRTTRAFPVHSPSLSAATMFLRAPGLASGATASSRSRNTWSAGRPWALSSILGLEPGTARQERRACPRGTEHHHGHPEHQQNQAGHLVQPRSLVQPEQADARGTGYLQKKENRDGGRGDPLQRVVEHRVAEQVREHRHRRNREPGAAGVPAERYPADEADGEQQQRAGGVADTGVRRRAGTGPGALAERGVDGAGDAAGESQQVTGEGAGGEADVRAGGQHRAADGETDADPDRGRQPSPLAERDQALPDRLGGDEGGGGGDAGELHARYPRREVHGQGQPGEEAGDGDRPAGPAGEPGQFGAAGTHGDRSEHGSREDVAPAGDGQPRGGRVRDQRPGQRDGEPRDHESGEGGYSD